MTLLGIRIVILALGLIVWGYGANVDDPQVRWIGIGMLALSLILRFFRPRQSRGPDGTPRD